MATFTENYSLIKPDGADYYDIADFNENFDAIDGGMAETAAAVAGVSEKIGTPTAAGATLFSLLEGNGGGLIKSLQHITCTIPANTESAACEISKVDPAKTIVFLERLKDTYSGGMNRVEYTLNASSMDISCDENSVGFILGFWIVEFY